MGSLFRFIACKIRSRQALGERNSTVISMNKYGEYGTCKAVLNYDWFVDVNYNY